MARFNITAPNGREIIVEGDGPPTDEEIDEILESLPSKPAARTRPALSDDEKPKSPPKPKREKEESSVEPSLMRGLMTVLKGLGRKLDESIDIKGKAPIINVAPPKVDVAAPTVNVAAPIVNIPKRPEHWRAHIVSRDAEGRVKEIDFKVVK